ncbi:MAG: leucine-rich repeat protein [Lachnospiraceae bacterium]|nr:leucine-rich repeat protein [Lachnospiraceae bacterium]
MKNKSLSRWLVIVLAVCMGLLSVSSAKAEGSVYDDYPVDSFNYTEVEYSYTCSDGESRTFYTMYNDGMLFADSYDLSPDVAKLTVGMAAAAYSKNRIVSMLRSMGYKPINTAPADPEDLGADEDFLYNYDRTATFSDSDFVGYSIGRKQVEYNGEIYFIYMVPVRGTPTSAEWFSDFRLNDDPLLGSDERGYHYGFKTAADEILANLKNLVHTENNIFVVTGHSRGAAVANIVSGELISNENYQNIVSPHNLFCYTYACPSVKKYAEELVPSACIRNYNNPGDVITAMPLSYECWESYSRYGQTFKLPMDTDQLSNVLQRFKGLTGNSYAGGANTDTFEAMALAAFPNTLSYEDSKIAIDLVALFLSGQLNLTNVAELLHEDGIPDKCTLYRVAIRFALALGTGLYCQANDDDLVATKYLLDLMEEQIAKDKEQELAEEEFMELLESAGIPTDLYLLEYWYVPKTRPETYILYEQLKQEYEDAQKFSHVEDLTNKYLDNKGHGFVDSIWHAHTAETYIIWINSMFYGFEGWKGNESVTEFTVPDQYYVGPSCFYGCENLESITINSTSGFVCTGAFAGCSGKEITLTMPIDSDKISATAFGCSNNQMVNPANLSNITTLCYTPGKTGIQRGRRPFRDNEGDGVYYMNVPEYYLRKAVQNLVFEEGVRSIGAYAWETSDRDSMYGTYVAACEIKSVTWPSTLETIGERAFFGRNFKNDSFLETVKEIGEMAFYDCQFEGTCVIPGQVEYIGNLAFNGARYSELIVEDPDTEMHSIFGYPIHKVTIPVDMKNPISKLGPSYILGVPAAGTKELRFTPGKTGVMPERIGQGGSGDNGIAFAIEAHAQGIEKIVFEEGVTSVCQSAIIRGNVQLPKSLKTITEDLSGNQVYMVQNASYTYSVQCPSATAVYGYPDTVAKSYCASKNLTFIPLHLPQFESDYLVVEHGSSVTIPVTIYTGIEQIAEAAHSWRVEGALSADTTIDGHGLLTLGEDEPEWNYIRVFAEYDGYESNIRIYVDRKAEWNHITLDPMGGVLPEGTDDVIHVESGTYAKDAGLPTPTMEGYTFDYWYYYSDDEGAFIEHELSPYDTFELIDELYAAWIEGTPPDPQPIDLSYAYMIFDQDTFWYSGEAIMPVVTLRCDGIAGPLVEGTEYSLSHTDNVNAGTVTVTATGVGQWYGSIQKTFTIERRSVIAAAVEEIPAQVYTGQECCPVPVVTVDGRVLEYGVDFETEYYNNIEVGTASVKIHGIGNYTGYTEKSAKFQIISPAGPPVISAQPQDVLAAAGEEVAFSVTASGEGLSRQWYCSADGGTSWEAVAENGTDADLIFTADVQQNGYQFRCEVRNEEGAVMTDPAVLTVLTSPSITAQPKAQTVTVDDKATFTVTAKGDELSYKWMYKKPDGDSWIAVSAASGKTAAYVLTAKASQNEYQYKCVVTNAVGSAETKAVTLKVKPKISVQPSAATVAVGKTAVFAVQAKGATGYQWYYRTSSSGSWTKVTAASGKKASYSMTVAARHNGYQYRCKVSNGSSYVYTKAVKLTAVSKPVITTQPKAVSTAAGKKITFKVTASGTGLSYQWYYRTSSTAKWKMVSSASGKKASYTMTAAAKHNGYQYRCVVSNVAGEVTSKTVKLTVK